MTTQQGYDALAMTGQGAYLMMNLNRAAGDGIAMVSGVDLTDANWIVIGQISRTIDIAFTTSEHDVTGPDDRWGKFVPGSKRVEAFGFDLLANPDLLTQSWRSDRAIDTRASLIYAYNNSQIRKWRIFTQQENYRGRAVGEFDAFIRQMNLAVPDNELVRWRINLRVTGPFLFKSDLSSDRRIVQDYAAPINLADGE